jgi:hypothetical protein
MRFLFFQGKGGRTVYLGPTSEALPYFEGLGIVCPPLVNPPGWCHFVCIGGGGGKVWMCLGVCWVSLSR